MQFVITLPYSTYMLLLQEAKAFNFINDDLMTTKYGPRRISKVAETLTKPIFKKRGFGEAAILNEWETVVGPEIAHHSCPERLAKSRDQERGAVLHLRVGNGAYATQLIHQEPQLIERINGYYGYKAIERIKIIQGPLPKKEVKAKQVEPVLDQKQTESLKSKLSHIEDPELREALEGLGRSVTHKQNTKKI
ncbi:MAG: DciA family protein [Rhodospirillales bacterium]|nr:DciA family protein [Rhodospirillales bacterium]